MFRCPSDGPRHHHNRRVILAGTYSAPKTILDLPISPSVRATDDGGQQGVWQGIKKYLTWPNLSPGKLCESRQFNQLISSNGCLCLIITIIPRSRFGDVTRLWSYYHPILSKAGLVKSIWYELYNFLLPGSQQMSTLYSIIWVPTWSDIRQTQSPATWSINTIRPGSPKSSGRSPQCSLMKAFSSWLTYTHECQRNGDIRIFLALPPEKEMTISVYLHTWIWVHRCGPQKNFSRWRFRHY